MLAVVRLGGKEVAMMQPKAGSSSTAELAAALAVAVFAVWAFAPAAANAQQLWSVGEVNRASDGPAVVMEGVAVDAGLAGPGGAAPPRVSAEVQVTYDYLRLGFGFLELPLPDGSVIEAENAVFEDRGDGNLMWTGEVPGAGYESVVFTVQDGHLVGWFGEPGGPKYVVHAGPDGRGTVAEEAGPAGDWCGVGSGPDELPGLAGEAASVARGGPGAPERLAAAPHGAVAADPPRSVASEANGNSLDILVLYTTGTERFWRVIGGPTVGIRQLGDYLNMVFRNGEIPATANLIGVRWDPELFNHPRLQGGHFVDRSGLSPWHSAFASSPGTARLRERYEPDLIHFVPEVGTGSAAGRAGLRVDRGDSYRRVYTGWSTPWPVVFAHEIGHNLGGQHEPATFGNRFAESQARGSWPYRFAHTDMTSCAKREGWGDTLVCPATAISYGQDTWADVRRSASTEPFYSSVRHRPNGWTIGVSGTSEVERLFHETVPLAVRDSEVVPLPREWPGRISARWIGRDTVRVTWSEEYRPGGGAVIGVASKEGANDIFSWEYASGGASTALTEDSAGNVTLLLEEDGSALGVDVAGLQPGGGHTLALQRWWYFVDGLLTPQLLSNPVGLDPHRPGKDAPAAPSGLAADVTGPDSLRLRWRDNSNNEAGFEVWGRKWSGEEPEKVWRRYGGRLPAGNRSADVRGLAAEEEIRLADGYWDDEGNRVEAVDAMRGRYSFVVVAYNDIGFSASETFHFEFVPGPYPKPTASGEVTQCNHRVTGVDLDGFDVWACVETPDGARRRAWDYGLDADQSGLLYFFDRDNVEILVKVLDGCGVNGHRWVFVAPVTDLAFRLQIDEPGPWIQGRRKSWFYDSKRRPQDRIVSRTDGNPKGRTARTVSDTTAFPCTTAEVAAAKAKAAEARDGASGVASGGSPLATWPDPAFATRLAAGAATDCTPSGPALTLSGGYTVSMCYETSAGAVGQARDWGLDSSQSALLYFFDRNNVEVLIKVLDGCGVNGHRWVFVAPVTDLAFNLHVESPAGERWIHRNRLGQTADAAGDTSAFPCSA